MTTDEWASPFERLERKWSTVPVADGRVESGDLLDMQESDLLALWDGSYQAEDVVGERGWYRLLYSDFVRGKKILDIGSGLGFDTLTFAQRGAASVTFADIVSTNLEVVARVADAKGVSNVEFCHVTDVAVLAGLQSDYDVVMAIGSLHHAPFDVLGPEFLELVRRLKIGGRWLQFAYPRTRWEREGSPSFDEWGEATDGIGTPWTEWYDVPKLLDALSPARFDLVFYTEWHRGDFNWFDLVFRGL